LPQGGTYGPLGEATSGPAKVETTIPAAPAAVRPPLTLVGDTMPIVHLDPAAVQASVARSEFGSSFDGAGPAVLSVAMALQGRTAGRGASLGTDGLGLDNPEGQPMLNAAQVVAATLDGDDSVHLVEALLRSNARPGAVGVQALPAVPALQPVNVPAAPAAPNGNGVPSPEAAAAALTPATNVGLAPAASWLTAVVATLTTWFWRRARRRRRADEAQAA